MARRTRRNLSDPKIKRIHKHQIQSSQNQISISFSNILFRRVIFPIFIILVIIFGYLLITNSQLFQFDSLVSSLTSSQDQALNEDETAAIEGKTNNTTDEIKTEEDKTPTIKPVERRIQVEVLNGCGVSGIAADVTEYLRKNNIDVVNIGNHTSFDFNKTKLWQRVNKTEPVQNVAALLGLDNGSIESKIDSDLQLDVTIILGNDYKTLKPFSN